VDSISKTVSKALDVFCVVLLVIMSLLVIVNVAMRFLLNSSIVFSEEISRFLFIWVVYIGAIIAVRDDSHIYVDFIRKKFPVKLQFVLKVVCEIAMILGCLLFFLGSIDLTEVNITDHSPVAGISLGFVYSAGLLGSFGMMIMLCIRLIRLFTNKAKPTDSTVKHEVREEL
jgi:TRAP-type C4-dicarboxylate transport system permease small subunit